MTSNISFSFLKYNLDLSVNNSTDILCYLISIQSVVSKRFVVLNEKTKKSQWKSEVKVKHISLAT